MARHNKPKPNIGLWDERSLRQARDWKKAGFSIEDIAQALNRNPAHVQMKWDIDGFALEIKPKTKRKCLSCTTVFDSEGPHNRLCDFCRIKSNTGASAITEE
jgi:DNA-binding transcriptional MerR regulator